MQEFIHKTIYTLSINDNLRSVILIIAGLILLINVLPYIINLFESCMERKVKFKLNKIETEARIKYEFDKLNEKVNNKYENILKYIIDNTKDEKDKKKYFDLLEELHQPTKK
ncbi:MAG TPA: hypothetical protein PLK15_01580 [Chitinophagales bacterium]|jgi:hypothetical protein|nr:hypothetical protein [Chitinophagales bacterium]